MTEPTKAKPTKEELAGYFAIYDRVGSKLSGLRDNMELKEGIRVDRDLKTQIATAMILDNKKPSDTEDVIRSDWSHLIEKWKEEEYVKPKKSGCFGIIIFGFIAISILSTFGTWLST
ncbi:MAG: hypothetical protein LR015_13960 [Verrucomicrobia bacterium]|nr:hypothetical protein [Verrucomicrobiota bacterium]